MAFSKTHSEAYLGTTTAQNDIDKIVQETRIMYRERGGMEHYTYADETGEVDVWLHRKEAARCDYGLAANKPSAASVAGTRGAVAGYLYHETDTGLIKRYDGSSWTTIASPNHSGLTLTYTTGTCDFTNGSATVDGTSTEWDTYISQYDVILGADGEYYNIVSVDSDTQLTLDRNYDGDTAAGQSYTIYLNGHPQYFTKGGGTVNGPVTLSEALTMAAAIAMGSNKITGLAAGTTNGDAVRYEQLVGVYCKMKVGTYTGDGQATQAITGVGFEPDVVLVYEQSSAGNDVHIKTASDPSTYSKDISDGGWPTDRIRSLDSDGFTVGNGSNINDNGSTYTYVAISY